ncbi:NUDIX domain-containing protein [Patescibacteria group bacterium]|nr:NUDIX domain-containing protein [Patescibacteria group bacterium]
MNYITTLKDKDIFKEPGFETPESFEKRVTVKAIVQNDEGKFGFVTNPVHNFFLLAGGGAESEDLGKEIIRECDEEINFEVEVIKETGRIQEFRNRSKKEYETVCFLVKTIKETNEDTRTEDEKKNELNVVWFEKDEILKILKEQEEKVKNGEVEFYNTAFNIIRDKIFFEEYLKDTNN